MLDRSNSTNLFAESIEQADEPAGPADAAVKQPARSPEAEEAEAQFDVSPHTAAPYRAYTRRRRPGGGGRRRALGAKPRLSASRCRLSLPGVPPRVRGWARRARPFTPALLLVVILAENPAGCAQQSTRSRSLASAMPAGAAPARIYQPTHRKHPTRPLRAPPRRRRRAARTDTAKGTVAVRQPAHARKRSGAPARAVPASPVRAITATVTRVVVPSPSAPSVANTGSTPPEGRSEGKEFGFER